MYDRLPHLLRSVVNFDTIRTISFLEMEIQSLWRTFCPVVMLTTSGAASHEHFCIQCVVISSLGVVMMTSSNGNIFRVTGPLCGEFTGHRWIPRTKASDAELWCFLWSAPEINGWVNNREAGDLSCHGAQYDVTLMGYSSKYMIGYPIFLGSVVVFDTIRTNRFLEMEIQSLWRTFC